MLYLPHVVYKVIISRNGFIAYQNYEWWWKTGSVLGKLPLCCLIKSPSRLPRVMEFMLSRHRRDRTENCLQSEHLLSPLLSDGSHSSQMVVSRDCQNLNSNLMINTSDQVENRGNRKRGYSLHDWQVTSKSNFQKVELKWFVCDVITKHKDLYGSQVVSHSI